MITLYTLPGCKICAAAKDKLRLLGLKFEERDLKHFITLHEGWLTDGSLEVQAAYAMHNNAVPLVCIDGVFFDYSGAMRDLHGK